MKLRWGAAVQGEHDEAVGVEIGGEVRGVLGGYVGDGRVDQAGVCGTGGNGTADVGELREL